MSEIVTITRQRLPYHPLLGRNVHHDSRSLAYALQPQAATVVSVRHAAHIDVLDQGQIGSCTGNASVSCAYHEPFFVPGDRPWRYSPDEEGAQNWYHDNTVQDGFTGTWPPDDTGSDGLTSSKVAQWAGVCPGYQAALDLDSSLIALMDRPGITGIPWFTSMFTAPTSGLLTVDVRSGLAGGHELCVDEVVAADDPNNGTGGPLVGGPNSWGPNWGAHGRWYMRASDWWLLRKQEGDVYFWAQPTDPAPVPSADAALWAVAKDFTHRHHALPEYRKLATGLKTWASGKGFAL